MIPLQLDDVMATVDVWELALTVALFLGGFVVVLVLGKAVLVPAVDRILSSDEFDEVVRNLGTSITNAVVWVAAIAVAFTVAGYGAFLSAFAIFGSAIGLAVGFAAQDLLSNFVAGIFILQDKPFQVGDWIEWEDEAGRVEQIDLRVTRVRSFDNEQITVPNAELANNAVTNPVAYGTLRQRFVFGIGYDDDVDQATDIILEEARAHDEILDDPGPSVRLVELGDSDVGLQARWWISEPGRADFVAIRSEFVQSVKEAFDDAGIDIPYVHRELTGSVEIPEQVEVR